MLPNIHNEDLSNDQIIELLKGNGNNLCDIGKTPERCAIAVKSNGFALRLHFCKTHNYNNNL